MGNRAAGKRRVGVEDRAQWLEKLAAALKQRAPQIAEAISHEVGTALGFATKVQVADSNRPMGVMAGGSLKQIASDLKFASRRGLVERFDGSIGAGSVLMPFGGKTQRTPAQAMAAPTTPKLELESQTAPA